MAIKERSMEPPTTKNDARPHPLRDVVFVGKPFEFLSYLCAYLCLHAWYFCPNLCAYVCLYVPVYVCQCV